MSLLPAFSVSPDEAMKIPLVFLVSTLWASLTSQMQNIDWYVTFLGFFCISIEP